MLNMNGENNNPCSEHVNRGLILCVTHNSVDVHSESSTEGSQTGQWRGHHSQELAQYVLLPLSVNSQPLISLTRHQTKQTLLLTFNASVSVSCIFLIKQTLHKSPTLNMLFL